MIYRKKVRLGDLLVQKGIITEEQLSEALKQQKSQDKTVKNRNEQNDKACDKEDTEMKNKITAISV